MLSRRKRNVVDVLTYEMIGGGAGATTGNRCGSIIIDLNAGGSWRKTHHQEGFLHQKQEGGHPRVL